MSWIAAAIFAIGMVVEGLLMSFRAKQRAKWYRQSKILFGLGVIVFVASQVIGSPGIAGTLVGIFAGVLFLAFLIVVRIFWKVDDVAGEALDNLGETGKEKVDDFKTRNKVTLSNCPECEVEWEEEDQDFERLSDTQFQCSSCNQLIDATPGGN